MVKSFFIKRVLKQYRNKLPKALQINYGSPAKSGYTQGQVLTTIKELKLSPKYTEYAILMFCGEQALHNLSSENLMEMTKLIGTLGSGGDPSGSGGIGEYNESFADSFDGGGGDGGGD